MVSTAHGPRDEDLPAVGGKRQRSPALEIELRQSLENRRRSPAAEAVNPAVSAPESANQSAAAPIAAPVPAPISAAAPATRAPAPPSSSEPVFAAQLRLEGRSRSPAIEADGSSGRPQPPADLRRRPPAASVTAATAPAVAARDASFRPSENQDLEAARRRPVAAVASGNAAAARPAQSDAVRKLCAAFLALARLSLIILWQAGSGREARFWREGFDGH